MNVIGVDIGGTSLRVGLTDECGALSAFEKVRQDAVLSGDPLRALGDFIEKYIGRHEVAGGIAGLAIALPGTLSKDKSIVLNLPNIQGLDQQPVKAALQSRFSLPVYLLKDVSALFYYDLDRFQIRNEGVIIACYAGTGIGNAISINGELLDGNHGSAGELGHIPVWGAMDYCGCGNGGCAETKAGGKYLRRLQREQFPDIPIERLFKECADHTLLREFVHMLAVTVATEINILDPEVVILGGGVISMAGFPLDRLEADIRLHARKPLPERQLRFLYSDNEGENGVIGAGIYAWKQIKERAAS